jgi:hypothetical protein
MDEDEEYPFTNANELHEEDDYSSYENDEGIQGEEKITD